MPKQRADEARAAPWFIPDRAISEVRDDHLDHASVANILVEAIRGATPPATIGLLGGFGKGKSSTGNLVIAKFDNDPGFDVVRVSADKHSGEARARNLVHSVAGEVVGCGVKQGDVEELARQLRESTARAALDPTDTPIHRLVEGKYKWRDLLPTTIAWVTAALLALFLLVGAIVIQGGFGYALAALTSLPLLAIALYAASRGTMRQIGNLLTPGLRTDSVPRAEAADDVELVFAALVDLHHTQRKRQLVVIVDDVDRLAPPDLLDALRVIKSLQAVPRNREPIFVLACDEDIVLAAIESAGPDESPSGAYDATTANAGHKADDDEDADPTPARPTARASAPVEQAADQMARAFLDKLFTIRITMPPVIEDDMREFANKAITADHPLRTIDGFPLERVLAVLMHDDVGDPRSVIRLLNRFFAAYLLGRTREQSRRLSDGAVTSHPIVLARLCVLADEFSEFYRQVAANPVLLEAADKLSQGRSDLSASEREAVGKAGLITEAGQSWVNDALRRYLRGTSRRIAYPDDLSALLNFAQTEGGRLLGAERRQQIRSALRSSDGERMEQIIDETPQDLREAVGRDLARSLNEADPIDASNYLDAAISAIPPLGADAPPLTAAAVDMLAGSPDANPGADKIAILIEHSEPSLHESLCVEMVRRLPGESIPDHNRRLAGAAAFSAKHPRLRSHIEPAVVAWLRELPNEGGWELGSPWIDAAETLVSESRPAPALVINHIAVSLIGLIHGPDGFDETDADRIVALAQAGPPADPAPLTDRIGDLDREAPSLAEFGARLLVEIGSGGSLKAALLAARAAASGEVAQEVRAQAASLVSAWAPLWAEESIPIEAEGQNDAREPVAPTIVEALVSAVEEAPDAPQLVARQLNALTAPLGDAVTPLVDALVTDALTSVDDPEWRPAGEEIALALVKAAPELPSSIAGVTVDRLLGRLVEDGRRPDDPACASALRLIPVLAGTQVGRDSLMRFAQILADVIVDVSREDRRNQVGAMSTIAQVAPDLVQTEAARVFSYYESLPAGSPLTEDQVRALALFPWSDDTLAGALTLIDARRDQIAPQDLTRSFELVPRALGFMSESQIPASLIERMVATLEGDPHTAATRSVAGSWKALDSAQRRRALRAGVGYHQDLDAYLQALSTEEAGEVILGSTDRDDAERLMEVLPESDRQAVSLVSLAAPPERPIEDGVLELLIATASGHGLDGLVEERLADLPASNEIAARTLRIVQMAKQRGIAIDLERIDGLLPDLIGEASEEVARLLGTLLYGRRLSTPTREALKNVREQDDRRRIAEAFDVAHSRR